MSAVTRAASLARLASGLLGLVAAWNLFSVGFGATDLGFSLSFERFMLAGASLLALLSVLLLLFHRLAVVVPFVFASSALAALEVPPIVPIRHFSDIVVTSAAVLGLATLILLVASGRAEAVRRGSDVAA